MPLHAALGAGQRKSEPYLGVLTNSAFPPRRCLKVSMLETRSDTCSGDKHSCSLPYKSGYALVCKDRARCHVQIQSGV